MKTTKFLGQDCLPLENGILKLLVTQSIGPRILSLGFTDGENLLAELPDFVTDCPGTGTFHFYGGHRLWHAPEDPARTYLPDDEPVEISSIENGLKVTQQTEAQTGLQKSIEIQLTADSAQVTLAHHLTNNGLWDVTCAPWAITQFKTGGTAIYPQIKVDTGVLPNRSLTLWPYTDMTNPNVHWGSNYIIVQAHMTSPFKIGFPNPRGWQAYWLNGTLFVKHAEFVEQAEYYDFGCSTESYINDKFVELETIAPITTIAPGATATHVETWNLYKNIVCPQNENEVQALADKLGLA
ncbi:MAG: hypothetical protein IPP66_08015 [Anaerolineales bacterium]|nr:hypothetical protein [Anaerolineales bacterium]